VSFALALRSPLTLPAPLRTQVVGFESALAIAKGVMRVGHAYRICQCSSAELKLLQALPIQVCDPVSIYVFLTGCCNLLAPRAHLSFVHSPRANALHPSRWMASRVCSPRAQ
jgi:hypothetical protein